MSSALEQVKKIIVEHLNVDPAEITLEAGIKEDLGADSLDVASLIMSLEEEFDMEVSDDEAEHITTVGDIVSYIEKQKK